MSSPRLLMLGSVNHPHVEHLAIAMSERGFDVTVAGDTVPDLPPSTLPGAGISVLAAPGARRGSIRGLVEHVRWIRSLVRRLEPDIVHAHWLCGYAFFAALAGASPLVAMAWGSDVFAAGRVKTLANRFALRRAAIAMADSQALLDRLVELGAPSDRTVLVNWGVDLTRLRAGRGSRACGAQELARPDARARDPEHALPDARLQPADDSRRVRNARGGARRRAARRQAHGCRDHATRSGSAP